jgi:hypothetical protein
LQAGSSTAAAVKTAVKMRFFVAVAILITVALMFESVLDVIYAGAKTNCTSRGLVRSMRDMNSTQRFHTAFDLLCAPHQHSVAP